jgi:hypothetical protein
MYKVLSTPELMALQSKLYTATEEAYGMAGLIMGNQDWVRRYRSLHTEVARLFLEAGRELLARFGNTPELVGPEPEVLQELELMPKP